MATKRSYRDRCGVARALDVVGERWALLVVRELLLGPKRFTDLRAGLPHVTADVLAQRLRELEQAGVVGRRKLPPPAASQVYELTVRGAQLEPVVIALGRWGANTSVPPADIGMSVDSLMLSLKTLFDGTLAGDLTASIALHLDDHRFHAEVAGGRLEVARGEATARDATIQATPPALLALIRARRTLDDTLAAGDVTIDGDTTTVTRFLGLFPLPAAVATPHEGAAQPPTRAGTAAPTS